MDRSIGTVLIGLGVVAIAIGVLARVGALSWFGRLPGDLRFEGEGTRVFVPLASMLVISIVASILLNLLWRR